jgi:hypothetical protein
MSFGVRRQGVAASLLSLPRSDRTFLKASHVMKIVRGEDGHPQLGICLGFSPDGDRKADIAKSPKWPKADVARAVAQFSE